VANKALRIGGTPLTVQVLELPPYVVGQWIGAGPEGTREVALEASGELLARPGESVVLDLTRLASDSEAVAAALARCITEAQRLGRNVCLVRCAEDLFRRLQRTGVSGAITHAGSLVAATQGLIGEATKTLDLHLRSTPDHLRRLRDVVASVARQAGLSSRTEIELKTGRRKDRAITSVSRSTWTGAC
jgi:anti-anti-sigma regulatory factor